MPLPTTFATLSTATGAQLDGNFSALGAISPIPGTLIGTNTLVLTPLANTPSVTALTQGQQYTAVVGATNTGPVLLGIGSLSALPVYRDTAAGPVLLSGGELVASNVATFCYDGALNSGSGGFHLTVRPVATAPAIVGSAARIVGSSAGAVTTASWTAVELVVEVALGGTAEKGSNLSLSFNGSTTGANGMDIGSMPVSGQLAVYAIYNPTTNTWATLGYAPGSVVASVVYNGTHLPPGYLYSALIWVGVTNASGQFQAFQQQDHQIAVGPASVLSATASVANTYASLSLSSIVPYSAVSCFGTLGTSTSNFGASLAIAASSAGAYAQYFIGQSNTNVLDGLYGACQFGPLPMVTPQTAWWKAATTTQTFNIFIRAYNF